MEEYEQAVFISYAWGGESEELVKQIDQALQQRGLKIIRDKQDLGYKGSISGFMERIGQGNCVIVVISDKYLRSSNCMFELVEIAEGKQFHDRVFPIVQSDANIYDPVRRLEYVKYWEKKREELAQAMREVDPANLQGIREDIDLYGRIRDKISGLTSILKDMNTLASDLHRDSDFNEIYAGIERRMVGTWGPLKPEIGESPYMGLRYFDTSDAALFYGREVLTDELLMRVQKESFLAIVGSSGSGKSSVARAGLIPAWKSTTAGPVYVITPSAHPLESLAASLTRESESVTATSTLIDDLMKDARSLRLYLRKMMVDSQEANLLLVIDQFEETFTLCKDPTERIAFVENLLSLADEDGGHRVARVVITLRADFYHHCFEYEGLRLKLEKQQANIGAMSSEELRNAITVPAQDNGWDFQPGLVDLILSDVGMEPGALPLFSHALLETWKRRQGRTLTLQGYADAGGVKKAIAQTAESVYDSLSPSEQMIARGIFLQLTEPGESAQDTRRRAKLNELARSTDPELLERVLKTLIDARLVTTQEDSAEVAHEALIREWRTLRKWLDEDRDSLRLHRHLTESAAEWERHGREAGELYRGTRLRLIQEWLKGKSDAISALEMEFLRASRNVKRQERLRWIALAAGGSLLLLVAVLGVTGQFDRFLYRPVDMDGYWVTIPSGSFSMGSDQGYVFEKPVHKVYLDAFQLGKYEVTNKQYNQCLRAGVCTGSVVMDKLDHPVININWYAAKTYCEWVGGRLPTEAEWEKAASWDDQDDTKYTYPWGEKIDCTYANYRGKDSGKDACVSGTTPVGDYDSGKSPYGVYDLAGNVWEWVNDWHSDTYFQTSPSSNPQGPAVGEERIMRGGSWNNVAYNVRSANRNHYDPSNAYFTFGFRCSRSLP
jgi:formylglycine-generating enzyme required for sulfatase activity